MTTPHEIRTFAREASRRARQLRASTAPTGEPLLQELDTVVEELRVSGEELRIQNDELLDLLGDLDAERSRSRALFELAPTPLLSTDRSGRIRDANEAALRLLGVDHTFFERRPLAVYVAGDDRRRFRSYLERVRRAGPGPEFGAGEIEISVAGPGREPVPVRVATRPVPMGRGGGAILWSLQERPHGKAEASRERPGDERERRRAAERVSHRALFLLRSLTDLGRGEDPSALAQRAAELAAAEFRGLAVVDVIDGESVKRASAGPGARAVLEWAPSLEEDGLLATMVGTASSVEGRGGMTGDVRRHLMGDAGADLLEELAPRAVLVLPMLTRQGVVGSLTLVRADDEELLEPSTALFARGFAQIVAFALEQATRLAELAREGERLQALSQERFQALTALSHELRTPLHSILGYCDLLLEGMAGELDGRATRMVDAVRASARHQADLVDGVLDLFRSEAAREEVHPEPVVVQELLREAATMVEELAHRKDLELKLEMPEEPVRARTDRGKLRQVLVNLLGNAVKYTDVGYVRLEGSCRGAHLCVEVEDTGPGIAPEQLSHVFEPFWRSGGERAGSGLGLAVTKRLVALLGGTVEVESEVGRGSLFRVVVPLEADGHGEGPAAA